jgi:hypothetical protein
MKFEKVIDGARGVLGFEGFARLVAMPAAAQAVELAHSLEEEERHAGAADEARVGSPEEAGPGLEAVLQLEAVDWQLVVALK